MRWKDGSGVRWRLRQQRLAWRHVVKPEAVFDHLPSGLGEDPVSLLIAAPFLLALVVLAPLWLAELILRLAAAPVAAVLRLVGAVPYRVDLLRRGALRGSYSAVGHAELVRLRAGLVAAKARPR